MLITFTLNKSSLQNPTNTKIKLNAFLELSTITYHTFADTIKHLITWLM